MKSPFFLFAAHCVLIFCTSASGADICLTTPWLSTTKGDDADAQSHTPMFDRVTAVTSMWSALKGKIAELEADFDSAKDMNLKPLCSWYPEQLKKDIAILEEKSGNPADADPKKVCALLCHKLAIAAFPWYTDASLRDMNILLTGEIEKNGKVRGGISYPAQLAAIYKPNAEYEPYQNKYFFKMLCVKFAFSEFCVDPDQKRAEKFVGGYLTLFTDNSE